MATIATATTMPRTPVSFNASQPPTSALPALPNTLAVKQSQQNLRRTSLLPTTPGRASPASFGRIPGSGLPRAPSLGSAKAPRPAEPKRSVSIASFPQPPANRYSGPTVPTTGPLAMPKPSGLPSSPMASPTRSKESLRRPNPKISSANLAARYSRDSGVGFIPTSTIGNGDYLSPPQSRSSSAQDSYSTSATTVDASPIISGDEARGRTDNREGGGEKESKGNVIISVRVRPDGPEDQMSPDWLVDGRRGRMVYRGKDGGTYEYDNVFTQSDNNARVYESCAKRLVRRVMEGYHGTVFAYGMTGTGKTFSMQGTTSSPGVIPLAITDIFSFIRETPHREFLLRVSYLEIYNEQIHDLLASEPGTKAFVPLDQQTKGEEIKLREDPKRGVYATPLKEEIVQSPTQLLRVIARGDLARRTGSTQYNARSSRSHAVVQIVVESRDRIAGASAGNMADNRRAGISGGVRVSTLSLIDLAGSERAAESKERRTEGAHINRSLLTLGTVIARLSKDGKDKNGNHLPYRDSKLTRLLQPALSGGSLISILCTIAVPMGGTVANNVTNIGETVNTLKFAARAKNNIISHAKKGEESFAGAGVDAGSKALLDRYRAEVAELRRELEMQRKKEDDDAKERESREEREMERHGEQLLEMQLARTALKERIEHLNRLILCSKSSGVNSARSSMVVAQPTSSARSSTTTPLVKDRLSNGSSITPPSTSTDPEDEAGEFNDGNASPAVQIRALQADLSDKTHYIAALEKRLLHVRRSSQSRASLGQSPKVSGEFVNDEGRWEQVVREKDDEIRELRERLDDKERMVVALRNAARKREAAEVSGRAESRMESRMGWRAESRGESRMAGSVGELKRGSGLSDLRRGNDGRGSIVETKRSSESIKRGSAVESLKRSSAAELRRSSGGG